MKKVDVKKLLDGIQDIHPILIGLAGAYLLCLPVVSPAENFYMEDFAFIGRVSFSKMHFSALSAPNT